MPSSPTAPQSSGTDTEASDLPPGFVDDFRRRSIDVREGYADLGDRRLHYA